MKEIVFDLIMDQIPKGTAQMKRANFRNKTFFEGKDLKSARQMYIQMLSPNAPKRPLIGPVGATFEFFYPIKDKRKKGQYKVTKPDCDNLVKLLQDCMTQLNYWTDDAQIARLVVEKAYSVHDHAQIHIRVTELEN